MPGMDADYSWGYKITYCVVILPPALTSDGTAPLLWIRRCLSLALGWSQASLRSCILLFPALGFNCITMGVCTLTVLISLILLCEQTHGPLSDRQADRLLAVIARGSVIPSASGLLLFPCKKQTGGQQAERPDPNMSLHKTLHDGDVALGANN